MTPIPGRCRRAAITLMRHACRAMPATSSPWAAAMRHELDHIGDDPAALRWAFGCLLACCRIRVAAIWRGAARHGLRHVAAGGVAMLLAGLVLQGRASGQTAPPAPAFAEAPCRLPGLSPEIRPRLRCGTVEVPRDYDHPGAGRFKLAVVVVGSAEQPALPDPVVYISGGPGNPLTIYAGHQARTPYAPRRDLILVDQRGTGQSEPVLCPGLEARLLRVQLAVAADASAASMADQRDAFLACREAARASGLDPREFGTRVTVEDFERVRQALGVRRWNVYGESYGTTVAMTLVALHPGAVRSAVLDSVYPPDPLPPQSARTANALAAFFAACGRDPACAGPFPGLADTYRAALERLRKAPLPVSVPAWMHQPDNHVLLTAPLFEIVMDNLIYYPSAYPGLPRLIQGVRDGGGTGMAAVLAGEMAEFARMNIATHAAVECRDRPDLHVPPPEGAGVLDRTGLHAVCRDWSEPGPAPLIPAGTPVPVLLLGGEFDPVAGPSVSRQVAAAIGARARLVEFAGIGHNVRAFSGCGAAVAAAFIGHPAAEPDASCADARAPIRFLPNDPPP